MVTVRRVHSRLLNLSRCGKMLAIAAFITVYYNGVGSSSSIFTCKLGVRGGERPVFMNDNDNGHSNSNDKKIMVNSANSSNDPNRDDGMEKTPPKYIFLLGERNSGTNYIEQLLMTSFYPKYSYATDRTKYKFAAGMPIFMFKHMSRHSILSKKELDELRQRQDILWILAVRNPCDWADGMYRKPWHMCLPSDPAKCKSGVYYGLNTNLLKNVGRASFFRDMPWWDYQESRKSTDFTYPTIFDLRSHKLRLMQQVIEATPRVKLVPLHYIELSPSRWINNIAREFGLEINAKAREMKPSMKSHNTLCLTHEEWHAAQSKIDWELEGYFGYTRLDCHTCADKLPN